MNQILHCAGVKAELIRSKRKSVGIYVRDGRVIVRAPLRQSLATINAFVVSKQQWIQVHLRQQQEALARARHSFANGDQFLLFNRPLTLQLTAGRPTRATAKGDAIALVCPQPANTTAVKKIVENWYKKTAEFHLQRRARFFSERLGLVPSSVTIRRFKSRWGSCTHDGKIQLNWLLMMGPEAVIDYVVVHELCHLKIFNHSPAFWRAVAAAIPDYRAHRTWLKDQTTLTWPTHD